MTRQSQNINHQEIFQHSNDLLTPRAVEKHLSNLVVASQSARPDWRRLNGWWWQWHWHCLLQLVNDWLSSDDWDIFRNIIWRTYPAPSLSAVTIAMSEIVMFSVCSPHHFPQLPGSGLPSAHWSDPDQVIRGLTLTGGQSAVKWELLRDVQATGYWGESPLTYHLTQG